METLRWQNDQLILLDQTKLPSREVYICCTRWQDVCRAISILSVRGAPAIGVAAAYGVVLAAQNIAARQKDLTVAKLWEQLIPICNALDASRPTAVNLHWALDRMLKKGRSLEKAAIPDVISALKALAVQIHTEDIEVNTAMAECGAAALAKKGTPLTILTHCNAGALATAGIGTALGVIRALHKHHLIRMVYADETRPLLQGARLTVTELMDDHIPVTLISDNMAAWVMKTKKVDAVLVGADRITHNGDTANKIGTYGVSILAKEHGIPFYVVAPVSTFDISLATGDQIPIEERNHDEVRFLQGVPTALSDAPVFNPAFDVTPHENIQAIITEKGLIMHPDDTHIDLFFHQFI
ncbi:methylthioribose-1-phosphate isomerase [Megasphaera cerevisiae DSM 20462]|jgi:methylthioribose-1-phosphate isomerase|uniref:Methylthioribose-1-phosphate isomerase n=1 Tax=Megasphaera cerevisiae DSM 20462 TaxID=1122219 RepID=A0A0J6ZSI5_9FIRM|nr:S-methyl-5-thioribose-1-phosphate isomerase [Megasphaera cerevisiae]KMO87921.1 methylthioribose-1-phosphate isomerase [Megasphaera cerevisiae DSM 20462]MCI1750065.1 S-methyl-5-thioribose-1-phosphate isomerase [Megasphaera cerevisiae]OKY53642.1 S-methyl-5-thioribose-1-phosphate isomerase [Megasphaera cerevisiae]SJZ43619.1 methylthioribose-1-phosphate isomerase [Megasphaera cerevisiae DSM 20462]